MCESELSKSLLAGLVLYWNQRSDVTVNKHGGQLAALQLVQHVYLKI